MRVLLTTDTIGGVWTFSEELARGLLATGHEVALLSFGGLPSSAQATAMHMLDHTFPGSFRFTASEAPLEWMQENDRTWCEGQHAIMQIIDAFQPHLLHSNQLCFGTLQSLLPVLVTAHSDVLSWAESTLSSVAELERTSSPAWLNTYRALASQGLTQASAVVTPTGWMADQLVRLYTLPGAPVVIANGVAVVRPAAKTRRLQAITAGRLWDQAKGLAILDQINPPMPIYVAGEQSSNSFPHKAEWLGVLPHRELVERFSESAIYLACSVYEPFGLSPLEAALCGCAIVARDLPTFREVWGDGALYFESAATLQFLLKSLTMHPHLLKAAQFRSARRAVRYTSETMTQQYVAIYQEILERRIISTSIYSREPAPIHA